MLRSTVGGEASRHGLRQGQAVSAGFAGYEVLSRVAQGSTGVVWQARQVHLERLVAIKELAPALLYLPGFLERFRSEAQVLAGLDDPHVVRLYDYVEEPDRAYLVEEWVPGAPLATVLVRHGRLTAEQSLGVVRGGLAGLAHAHDRGLVHRDVSLSNILLDVDGVSKLVDFGLAAPVDGTAEPSASAFARAVGTPAFGSPEAVQGQPLTPRSDVYSAAAVLYTLLTGNPPYAGDTQAMLRAHVNRPAPVLSGFATRLTNLLSRAMAKHPEQRPADAREFLAELEEAARDAYGVGWLSRASVAGLATAGAAGAAGTAAAVSTAAAAGGTPAASVIQAGARSVLGLPRVAFLAAAAAIVIAVAAVTVALTVGSGNGPAPTADGGPAAGTAAGAAEPTASEAPLLHAFSGTYSVVRTLTSVPPNAPDPVGMTTESTWIVAPTCASGPCDVNVATSFGLDYPFAYSDGVWRAEVALELACFDIFGQSSETVPATDTLILSPGEATAPGSDAPLATLTGVTTEVIPVECGGAPGGTFEIALQLTRTGD